MTDFQYVLEQMLPNNLIDEGMIFQRNRLATFNDWPFNNNVPCSREKLAEAGYFMNRKDANSSPNVATCFVCFKSLYWEETDNPWEEHINHAQDCSFAKLNKKESEQTLEEFLEIVKQSVVNYKKICIEVVKEMFEAQINNYYNIRKAKKEDN